jgi:GNAT superfamily N-acetyltransferase
MQKNTILTITPAIDGDQQLILDFIRQLARYEKLEDQVSATAQDLQRTLFGERPAAEVVIARLDGDPVGFALFFANYSTFLAKSGLYLEDLFVDPEYRGRGVGEALLRYLAAEAVARGCGRFEWSVLDWNEPAIGFYKRLGAEPMNEWTVHRLEGEALHKLANERKG